MPKKLSKEKDVPGVRDHRCPLCVFPHPAHFLLLKPTTNLHRKYLQPQLQTYHYRTANNFIYDPASSQAISVVEMTKLIHRHQHLSRYYSFSQTAQTIRSVVLARLESDFYGCVDFSPEHFLITNLYYVRRKQLVRSGRVMRRHLGGAMAVAAGEGEGVREYLRERVRRELDSQRLVKLAQNETNSSTIDMQRLGRHLEQMLERITDLSCIRPMRGKGRVGDRKELQKNISLVFKLSNCGDISAIGRKREEEYVAVGEVGEENNYQESYGLETIRPKNSSKKVNKLTLRSMEKISGFEDKPMSQTPKPRFFHSGNQYDEIQLNKPGGWSRSGRLSRDKNLQPMSPGNNRSSSLSQRRQLKRNGSQISRKAK